MTPTAEVHEVAFKGELWNFMRDETRYIDIEGAFRSGKTTAVLWKVLKSCIDHPGIQWLICRFSDGETRTKLRPRWREVCDEYGVPPTWNPEELAFDFPNGSKVYCFGLKAADEASKYAKLRGLTLAGVYVDQAEELPEDVYTELKGRLSQPGQPHQLILSPNPPSEDSWLAVEFPEDNHVRHHQYYRVSIYDNEHNLDPETVPNIEAAYPVGHAKHGPAILGLRGLNVTGKPVYGAIDPRDPKTAAFHRDIHERPLALNPNRTLYEAIDYGSHHPCVVWAQFTPWAEMHVLGGLLGQDLSIDLFGPIVQQYRAEWFPKALEVATCCDPAGSHRSSQGHRENGVELLVNLGFAPTYQDNSNAPDVRDAMIERIKGFMRRRTPNGEAFGVDRDRWYRISATAVVQHRFLADGFQAGYVWDKHMVSVGNKKFKKPKKDGWYEHGQNCLEYLAHNFGGVQPTLEQEAQHALRVRYRGRDQGDPIEKSHAQMMSEQYGYRPKPRASGGFSRGGRS